MKFVIDLADQWFLPGTLVSSTNKNDRHSRYNEILLKVALNTIALNLYIIVHLVVQSNNDFKLKRCKNASTTSEN
jgi:hypothetical protein